MVKQILIPLAAVALFIVLVGYFTKNPKSVNLNKYLNFPTSAANPTTIPNLKTVKIGNTIIKVEIANTEPLREKGLGGRTELAPDSGMLFVFDSKNVNPTFWMKDMLIPLDLIWISGGKISKIDSQVPAPSPGVPDEQLKIYPSEGPIDYVLEVASNFSSKNNIKVGDSVDLSGAF